MQYKKQGNGYFDQAISQEIWEQKYKFKGSDEVAADETINDNWRRVANFLASPEDEDYRKGWEAEFYNQLKDFKFLPAGRIMSNAGTGRSTTTCINCFVMGTIPDSMEGIFESLKEAALTMQAGGGIGYDFSTIRPKGEIVKGVGEDASGPLSFMDVWNSMCGTVMSAGARRGAMMATMRCDHPDIEDFIKAKRDGNRLRMFNVSVLCTDHFMDCVDKDLDFDLKFNGKVYRTVKARHLWDQIMINTYDYAEPGVIFIDRVNYMHNQYYLEQIASTNPCGEQPLPPYGSCLLGSINLSKFVKNFFAKGATIDWKALGETTYISTRMLDNVIEVSNYPLEKQRDKAKGDRRLGLGVTGLADMLCMLGIRYGSKEAIEIADKVQEFINSHAYQASIELAQEKGQFPDLDREKFVQSGFMKGMSDDIVNGVLKHGIRNATLTSIAPTGTISIVANNISSGIEPIFAYKYVRKVLQNDNSTKDEVVMDYAVWLYKNMFGQDAELPDYFVTAGELTPDEHISMQAAVQKNVDTSISKTVNVDSEISFDEFKNVYMTAYKTGCKGCTTYRPSEVRGAVLVSLDETPSKEDEGGACEIKVDENTGVLIRSCE